MNYYSITINAEQVHLSFSADGVPEKVEVDSMATAEIRQLLREQFEPKKRHNLFLADAYQVSGMNNGPDKAVRLASCARWLEFAVPPEGDDKRYKITKTSSCHVRLCPVCQWRRSVNTYRNMAQIYAHSRLKEYKHIFVTVTQKNVPAEELGAELKRISDAYTAMLRRKPFKDIVKGYARTIEVTRNEKTGEYHPHIHAIWTVHQNYGRKVYITQEELRMEWAKALGLDYLPQCNMKKIKNVDGKSLAEISKYSVKPGDYITNSLQESADLLRIIDPALDGKRFVSYGGLIREIKQDIFRNGNLEDIESNPIPATEWETWERHLYEWHFSAGKYRRITV